MHLKSWDLVAHPVTQVIGEQALVDILDLSEVAWTCWGKNMLGNMLAIEKLFQLNMICPLNRQGFEVRCIYSLEKKGCQSHNIKYIIYSYTMSVVSYGFMLKCICCKSFSLLYSRKDRVVISAENVFELWEIGINGHRTQTDQ